VALAKNGGLDYHYTADSGRSAAKPAWRTISPRPVDSGPAPDHHARDAIDEYGPHPSERNTANGCLPLVMHASLSTQALGRAAPGIWGIYLSICRDITAFPQIQDLARHLFRGAPLDRILVWKNPTGPYLAPPRIAVDGIEPAFTAHTARRGAETFGIERQLLPRKHRANLRPAVHQRWHSIQDAA